MSKIEFSKEEKTVLVERLQRYFSEELDQDLGGFDAQFLLDFFSEELGAVYYNQGLYDAQALFRGSVESILESIHQIEKTTPLGR